MALGEQLVEVPVGQGEERVFIANSDPVADPVYFGTGSAGGKRVEVVLNPASADRRVRIVPGGSSTATRSAAVARAKQGGWFAWALIGIVAWFAVSIAVISGGGMSFGAAAMLLLATPLMGPPLGWGLRLMLRVVSNEARRQAR